MFACFVVVLLGLWVVVVVLGSSLWLAVLVSVWFRFAV